ncbi:MAG: hypothetical protein KGL26_13225, partial [Pseudomonadota bacterium]|nr:hypothetical protein [Pseudomonadota bacterium]
MRKVLFFLFMLAGVTLAASLAVAASKPAPGKPVGTTVDFTDPDPVLRLGPALSHYHAPDNRESDGYLWYLATVANPSLHPVTRVLLAEERADAALH